MSNTSGQTPAPNWGEAPKPGVIPLRPLELGEIFGGAIASIRSHAKLVFGLSLAVALVNAGLGFVLTLALADSLQAASRLNGSSTPAQGLSGLGVITAFLMGTVAISLVSQVFLTGILTVVVSKAVLGRTVGLNEAWAELRPRTLPLLGLTLLNGLLVFVGALLCVVPGVWIGILISLSSAALVLEQTTVKHALQRSRSLVTGSWWRVFGVLVLSALVAFVVTLVIQGLFGAIGGASGTELGSAPTIAESVGGIIASAVIGPFSASVSVLLYIDQRIRREGLAGALATAAAG
jgi:hypothetical protein